MHLSKSRSADRLQPNYWCKHCKTYVRDTPLEKKNHEATPRHQGNLKRFVRDLHRENERAERDKQRAKDEVARLNGAVPTPGGSGQFKPTVTFTKTAARNANPDERKRQMAQLAEMGVAVPDDFRRENAMAGDWEIISQHVVAPEGSEVKAEGDGDVKSSLNVGVRKRKAEEEVEEVVPKLEEGRRRPRWGTDTRTLPGDSDDLDALLSSTSNVTKKAKTEMKAENNGQAADGVSKHPPDTESEPGEGATVEASQQPAVKTEDSTAPLETGDPGKLKNGNEEEEVGAIFKKRKPKGTKMK